MKNSIGFLSAAFILFVSLPSPIQGFERSALLSTEDLAFEEVDRQQGPALSSAIGDARPWATYNQWICFEAGQVQLESVEIKSDANWIPWPQLTVITYGQNFELSPETDLKLDAEKTLGDWKALLDRSREICFYAAFLQYLSSFNETPDGLWVLKEIKTENGYWRISEAD